MSNPILLQDITATDELAKFLLNRNLLYLLAKEVNNITFRELTLLSNSEIYCSQSVGIHDELQERLHKQMEVANA